MRHNRLLARVSSGSGPLDPRGLYEPLDFVGVPTATATSADYMAFLAPSIEQSAVYDETNAQYAYDYAIPLMAAVHKTGAHAAKLRSMLLAYGNYVVTAPKPFFTPTFVPLVHKAFEMLRPLGLISGADETWLLEKTEYALTNNETVIGVYPLPHGENLIRGAHHRSMAQLAGFRTALAAYPAHPDAEMWEDHIERLWSDWYGTTAEAGAKRDFAANDTTYHLSAMMTTLAGLVEQPLDEAFDGVARSRLWERSIFEISPDGVAPVISVSGGRNTFAGVRILANELAAAKSGDGRFRWAASRMFRWAEANGGFSPGWETYRHPSINALALAVLVMDDGVVPVEPSAASKFRERVRMFRFPSVAAATAATGYPVETGLYLETVMVPDKIVLRSSWQPGSLYALVECFSRHDPLNTTSIVALERWGSAQLEQEGDMVSSKYSHQSDNLINIENLDGDEPIPVEAYELCVTSVPAFSDKPLATHARINVTNYMAYQATQERELLFVKDRFIVIRDQTSWLGSANVAVGPQWNANYVAASGANWFDCYWKDFGSQGISIEYENPRWNTLVFYAPKGDATLAFPAKVKNRIKTKYGISGARAGGDVLQFGTLLLPHGPKADAAEIVAGITVLHDTPGLLAIIIALGKRWEFVLLNPTGQAVAVPAPTGTFNTKAKALYLDFGHGKERGREEWA